MHTTSLNINKDLFDMMKDTAEIMDISISTLIKRIITRFSDSYTPLILPYDGSVAYQSGCRKWHIFPFSCSDVEYEQFLDIRKVWKLSVSFFVSISFLFFLQENEKDQKKSSPPIYSYMLDDYSFEKFETENGLLFKITWLKEKKKPKLE